MDAVRSKTDVPIRLTEERWFHITEEHSEMAGYYFEVLEAMEEPEAIYEGKKGECIAMREIEKDMAAVEMKNILTLVPELLKVSYSRIWTSYDKEVDVLYINFKKPSHADDSELTDENVIIRYEKGEIVGITILNASRRKIGQEHCV